MANLERERKEDAVKEEISGEPIRKPVFKIKRPKRKKKKLNGRFKKQRGMQSGCGVLALT